MKKRTIGPLVTVIVITLLIALFVYFFVSLNKIDKKTSEISQTVSTNASQTSAVVNFFNSNLNASQE